MTIGSVIVNYMGSSHAVNNYRTYSLLSSYHSAYSQEETHTKCKLVYTKYKLLHVIKHPHT